MGFVKIFCKESERCLQIRLFIQVRPVISNFTKRSYKKPKFDSCMLNLWNNIS